MTLFRFHLSWFQKNDINQYPTIFSRAINVDSSERYVKQIHNFFAPLNNRGFEPVSISAYLDKKTYEKTSESYRYEEEKIMNQILPKARNHDYDVVFVYDIKDITMLPVNHILELSMLRPDISVTSLYMLQKRICDSVNYLQDSNKNIRKVDNIEDVLDGETDEMRKAAPVYENLRELYNNVRSTNDKEKESIIPHDLFEKLGILEHKEELCQVAEKQQEVYNQRWKTAKKCLELVNRRSTESKNRKYANIVLCNQGIASAAAQLLVAGLSIEVPIENIYSTFLASEDMNSWYRMKDVVSRIQQRFGQNCVLIHVASGPTYGNIPLQKWPISANDSFDFLYKFQRDSLLY